MATSHNDHKFLPESSRSPMHQCCCITIMIDMKKQLNFFVCAAFTLFVLSTLTMTTTSVTAQNYHLKRHMNSHITQPVKVSSATGPLIPIESTACSGVGSSLLSVTSLYATPFESNGTGQNEITLTINVLSRDYYPITNGSYNATQTIGEVGHISFGLLRYIAKLPLGYGESGQLTVTYPVYDGNNVFVFQATDQNQHEIMCITFDWNPDSENQNVVRRSNHKRVNGQKQSRKAGRSLLSSSIKVEA